MSKQNLLHRYFSWKTYIHCAQNDNLFISPKDNYNIKNDVISKSQLLIFDQRTIIGPALIYGLTEVFNVADMGAPDDSRWCI